MKYGNRYVACVLFILFIPAMATAYFEDFESGAGSEWSSTMTNNDEPADFTRFLGRFGNVSGSDESVTLTLSACNSTSYLLEFDLYVIDSWDGTAAWGGPDYFNVSIDGGLKFHHTFANATTAPGPSAYQSFREPDIGRAKMGFNADHHDAIYLKIQIPFTASGSQMQITFQGVGLQPFPDETWGLDNVSIAPEPAGPEMVVIPAGWFPYQNTTPEVFVETFYIGKYETTNTEYCQFLNSADPNGDHYDPNQEINQLGNYGSYTYTVQDGKENYPIRWLTLDDVNAFAQWRSTVEGATYRLPTEQEWEKAAAWDPNEQHHYIYGFHSDSIDCSKCNYNFCVGNPTEVGSYPYSSYYGCYDMSGNVWEMTSSISVGNILTCGGYWETYRNYYCQTTSRGLDSSTSRYPHLGFRIVREPELTFVEIDIKPSSCPNPLNVGNRGVLPVAILGSECFDVTSIDVASIRLAGVAPVRSSYEDVAAPVARGPIAYWSFDDSGDPGHDDSGNGHNGTLYGDISVVDGICAKALSFDGNGDYVDVPDADALDPTSTQEITITAWVYITTYEAQNSSNYFGIVGKTATTGRDEGNYVFCIANDNESNPGKLRFALHDASGFVDIYNDSLVPKNQWVHVAFTHDVSKNSKFFINGTLDGLDASTITGHFANSDKPFNIGHTNSYWDYFYGSMDEVRIYDRALSGSEIEELAGPTCDVAECECTTEGPDGYTDLTLKFKTQEIVTGLREVIPADVNVGETVQLTLTGELVNDEGPIEGTDCMVIVGNKLLEANLADIDKNDQINLTDFFLFKDGWIKAH